MVTSFLNSVAIFVGTVLATVCARFKQKRVIGYDILKTDTDLVQKPLPWFDSSGKMVSC